MTNVAQLENFFLCKVSASRCGLNFVTSQRLGERLPEKQPEALGVVGQPWLAGRRKRGFFLCVCSLFDDQVLILIVATKHVMVVFAPLIFLLYVDGFEDFVLCTANALFC